jgi:hypothetical protein
MADDAPGTAGHSDIAELAQLVLQQVAPEELVIFDDTAEEYFEDPDAVLHPRRRDEAVGFGLDLAMLTPLVLAVASSCLTFVAKTLAETFTSEAAKPAIGDFLRRFGHEPPEETPSAAALSREQAEGVRKIAAERAQDLGLPAEKARLLADAVVGGLNVAT